MSTGTEQPVVSIITATRIRFPSSLEVIRGKTHVRELGGSGEDGGKGREMFDCDSIKTNHPRAHVVSLSSCRTVAVQFRVGAVTRYLVSSNVRMGSGKCVVLICPISEGFVQSRL
jgi:hypothetical protein